MNSNDASIKVVCPYVNAGTGSDRYFERLRLSMINYDIEITLLPLSYFFEFVPFLSILLAWKLRRYDLIHTNMDYASNFSFLGKPLVATFHHDVFDKKNIQYASLFQKIYYNLFLKVMIKRASKKVANVIFPSYFTRDSFLTHYQAKEEKTKVIYNSVDVSRFRVNCRVERDPKLLIFVGSRSRRKGFDVVLKIMEKLGPSGYHLVCVGGGKTEKGVFPYTKFSGAVSESSLVELYQRAGCLVSPTRLEGFGYSLLEAALCGCYVLSSNCSAVPEVVGDFPNCKLMNEYDVDAWCEEIKKIDLVPIDSDCHDLLREKFSVDVMAEKYADLYRNVLA